MEVACDNDKISKDFQSKKPDDRETRGWKTTQRCRTTKDHAVTRGWDESLRYEGGHSPEYHTVVLETPTSSRYREPHRPDVTDS